MSKITASIEARMGSSRLPGKVLMDINGKPMLSRLVNRLKKASLIDEIVLATTTKTEDDKLEAFAFEHGIKCFRGSENDVLDRVVRTHQMCETDIVVELTGDCPMIDPVIIDSALRLYLNNDCDLVTNAKLPLFPEGLDVQVYSLKDLLWVRDNIEDNAVREHVSLYFYENPDKYRLINMAPPDFWYFPNVRLQVDYKEDLIMARKICEILVPSFGDHFSAYEIIKYLREHPNTLNINKMCLEKPLR